MQTLEQLIQALPPDAEVPSIAVTPDGRHVLRADSRKIGVKILDVYDAQHADRALAMLAELQAHVKAIRRLTSSGS